MATPGQTPIDLNYFCGFFDGEGCIIVTTERIRLSVDHTFPPVLEAIRDSFGGEIYGPILKEGSKPNWRWQIGGGIQVAQLLKLMLPHLREKRRQAEIAIDWVGSLPNGAKRDALTRLARGAKKIDHYERHKHKAEDNYPSY